MPVYQDIYDYVQPILGVETIWEDSNVNRPAFPYATLKINSPAILKEPYYGEPNAEGIRSVWFDIGFTLSVNYHANGFDPDVTIKLLTLAQQMRLISNMVYGFAFERQVSINDTSYSVGKAVMVKRSTSDLYLRYKSEITENVGLIETVNATYLDQDDSEIMTIIKML